jgi:hypothetical protein
MKSRLPESWRLHACNSEHLAVCRDLGLLGKVIYFPYNLVETEPSAPLTELRFDAIDREVSVAADVGVDGIQGNAQTPLAQWPNIAYLSHRAWGGRSGDGPAVLQSLARRLVRRDADALVQGWESLGKTDAAVSADLAKRLRALAGDPLAGGTLGVIMGDWQARVVADLAYMLEIHARAVELTDAASGPQADLAALRPHMIAYLDAAAKWLERTGYHNVRIVCHEAFRDNVQRSLEQLTATHGREMLDRDLIRPATDEASAACDPQICRAIVDSLLGERK